MIFFVHDRFSSLDNQDLSFNTFRTESLWVLLARQVPAVLASCADQQRAGARGHARSTGPLSAPRPRREVSD